MEKEINIAEILKNKPQDTVLYSPICGKCTLLCIKGNDPNGFTIRVEDTKGRKLSFTNDGRYYDAGELLLFPSNVMRDWSKLTWKKGDVLVSNDGCREVIFTGFEDDDYRTFKGKHWLDSKDENNIRYSYDITCESINFFLEEKDATKCYINTIEERLGGKLNMETLEVEKPECEFKPLQYVLARDNSRTDWTLCQFSHIDKQGDVIFVGGDYTDKDNVIPYEGNEHLLGTTDNWEK